MCVSRKWAGCGQGSKAEFAKALKPLKKRGASHLSAARCVGQPHRTPDSLPKTQYCRQPDDIIAQASALTITGGKLYLISKLKVKKLMLMSQVLNEFENQQKPTIAHVQQILHGRSSGYGRSISSPIMQRMALNALSQAMGAKRKFGRLFTLGYDDDSAFDCMLIIARLVSLRQSLARSKNQIGGLPLRGLTCTCPSGHVHVSRYALREEPLRLRSPVGSLRSGLLGHRATSLLHRHGSFQRLMWLYFE